MNKVWKKPELVVLVKGTGNEQVLCDCKSIGGRGPNCNGCKYLGGTTCRDTNTT